MLVRMALGLLLAVAALAQTPCGPTPLYGRCEIVFELNSEEKAAHPNPYLTVQLHGEFRSPRHRTLLLPAFWDGDGRMVIRFAPIDPGDWEYRITSNITRWNNQLGKVTATASDQPGFIAPANGHHWRYTENLQPHLWMGDTSYGLGWLPNEFFRLMVVKRAEQKFNHIRGLVLGGSLGRPETFVTPDQPDPAFYRSLDERVACMNSKGIVFDMILGGDENHLARKFPAREQRERYIRYMVARYSAFNVTWQITQEFEEYDNGRELVRELGLLLKKIDPYNHPRTTHAVTTSAPLAGDGWMDYITYQSSDNHLGTIEHLLHAMPAVNAEFGYENSGAGATHAHHVDSDEFRRRLWNSFMNGQYPTFGNTGTYGSTRLPQDPKYLDSPGAKAMTVWWNLVSKTRYWELEPYFDLDGGRAIAVGQLILSEDRKFDAVEYIVYIEKPSGPIEIRVEKHTYDVKWVNPITGEVIPQKEFKSDKYIAQPPDSAHDWVLHISREGKKEGMLRSYKFESRPFLMQEVEMAKTKVPFELAEPASDEISIASPPRYAVKLARQSRATRRMMYLWTGEVAAEGQGTRVLGTGAEGTWRFDKRMARRLPTVMNVRVYGMNANGKLYALDRIYRVGP